MSKLLHNIMRINNISNITIGTYLPTTVLPTSIDTACRHGEFISLAAN